MDLSAQLLLAGQEHGRTIPLADLLSCDMVHRFIAPSCVLFHPLKREAIYEFLISGDLHAFEKVMRKRQPCLVRGSGYN